MVHVHIVPQSWWNHHIDNWLRTSKDKGIFRSHITPCSSSSDGYQVVWKIGRQNKVSEFVYGIRYKKQWHGDSLVLVYIFLLSISYTEIFIVWTGNITQHKFPGETGTSDRSKNTPCTYMSFLHFMCLSDLEGDPFVHFTFSCCCLVIASGLDSKCGHITLMSTPSRL
jgi:hypothetical protein